jgi:hypothetical protein
LILLEHNNDAVGVRIDKMPVDQELIANALWEREGK